MRLSLIVKHLRPAGVSQYLHEANLHLDGNEQLLSVPFSLLVLLLLFHQFPRYPFYPFPILRPHLLFEVLILDDMAENVGVMIDGFHDGDIDEIEKV